MGGTRTYSVKETSSELGMTASSSSVGAQGTATAVEVSDTAIRSTSSCRSSAASSSRRARRPVADATVKRNAKSRSIFAKLEVRGGAGGCLDGPSRGFLDRRKEKGPFLSTRRCRRGRDADHGGARMDQMPI